MNSPTLDSIKRIQNLIDQMKAEGVDPISIYAALAQLTADIEPEAKQSVKDGLR